MVDLITLEHLPCQEIANEILDKISKYGLSSMTQKEREFLDAVSSGDGDMVRAKINELNRDTILEDRYFRFELGDIIYEEEYVRYIGTIYVPDLKIRDKIIEGNIVGEILLFNNGIYSLEFEKVVIEKKKEVLYDIFEFCNGLEYELDSFIDYIIQEL